MFTCVLREVCEYSCECEGDGGRCSRESVWTSLVPRQHYVSTWKRGQCETSYTSLLTYGLIPRWAKRHGNGSKVYMCICVCRVPTTLVSTQR